MATVIFDTAEEASNVMEQLPPEARAPNSGFMAKELDDGKYELTVPKQWTGAVKRADPNRVPPPPPCAVPKSLIMDRLAVVGKADGAFAALMADPALFVKWFSPDKPTVDSSDPDTIAFIKALEEDPDAILAKP